MGANYEGKGLIAGHLASGYEVAVRVGAANAGHTVYVDGEKHVVQQLPCAAYANPFAKLVLGAGAMISPGILINEIVANVAWRKAKGMPALQLFVDHRAHAVTSYHVAKEQEWGLAERIGSTSAVAKEGIGAAQVAKVKRRNYRLAMDAIRDDSRPDGHWRLITFCDTVELLYQARVFGTPIMIEGTQGTGLDNTLGRDYPYVTSRAVTAGGLLADTGFGPKDVDQVIVVMRTFPIRVAGNSGPFWPDSKEIEWSDLGVDPDSERTTVTKKVRRVATFSYAQAQFAARVNSATEITLTFCDYLCPEIAGRDGVASAQQVDAYDYVGPMIRRIEHETQTRVTMLGTGPASVLHREPPGN